MMINRRSKNFRIHLAANKTHSKGYVIMKGHRKLADAVQVDRLLRPCTLYNEVHTEKVDNKMQKN